MKNVYCQKDEVATKQDPFLNSNKLFPYTH